MESRVQCPSHPDVDPIEDHRTGDMICVECGLVLADRLVEFGPTRPPLTTADIVLAKAYRRISKMCDELDLSWIMTDKANILFKQFYFKHTLDDQSIDAMASACLYIACTKEGIPRTVADICDVSKSSKKYIDRCRGRLLKALKITPDQFVTRFCANLGLHQRVAIYIARKAIKLNVVVGHKVIEVAAAAIYMASQASVHKKTAKQIANIADVSDTAVKDTYNDMLAEVKQLLPPKLRFKVPTHWLPWH